MAATIQPETLYTTEEVATIIGRSPITLGHWRMRGEGPDFVKMNGARGAVLYRGSDLMAWLASRVVRVGATPATAQAAA